jgi:hypothetical protein
MQDHKDKRQSVRRQRLVLLALAAPLVAIGITLWFFLPGSVAGLSYTPGEFSREARLRPLYWSGHTATLRGALTSLQCAGGRGPILILSDTRLTSGMAATCEIPDGSIIILPQHESSLHAALRHALPGLFAAPLTSSSGHGQMIRFAGTLQPRYNSFDAPVVRPADL